MIGGISSGCSSLALLGSTMPHAVSLVVQPSQLGRGSVCLMIRSQVGVEAKDDGSREEETFSCLRC